MTNDKKSEIVIIKNILKNYGFTIKNQTCYKKKDDMVFVVFFQKRSDGVINTNLGISLSLTETNYSYKNCDIGYTYWSTSAQTTSEKSEEIIKWFEDRNDLDKISSLYKKNILSDFVSEKARFMLNNK